MAQGIYRGARTMRAEKMNDLRSLALSIEQQQEKFAKGMGYRKLIDKGGDFVKKLVPGIGHVLDLAFEETYGKRIPIGDEKKIEKFETPWTGTGYAEEFGKMKKEATPSFLDSLLSQGLDYIGASIAGEADLPGGSSVAPEGYSGWEGEEDYNVFRDIYSGIRDLIPSKGKKSEKDKLSLLDYFKNRGRDFLPDFLPEFKKGGMVQDEGTTSSITDYFAKQNKTLGGSYTQSLTEMLNRR